MDIVKLHDRADTAEPLIGGNHRFVKIAHGEPGETVPATGVCRRQGARSKLANCDDGHSEFVRQFVFDNRAA